MKRLWENLGRAQVGLKKYEEVEKSFNHVLEIQASGGCPKPDVQAFANAALGGEVYARTGKVPEEVKAFDLAAQFDAAHASMYLKSQALIFF